MSGSGSCAVSKERGRPDCEQRGADARRGGDTTLLTTTDFDDWCRQADQRRMSTRVTLGQISWILRVR
jgi:hypothetical protein